MRIALHDNDDRHARQKRAGLQCGGDVHVAHWRFLCVCVWERITGRIAISLITARPFIDNLKPATLARQPTEHCGKSCGKWLVR